MNSVIEFSSVLNTRGSVFTLDASGVNISVFLTASAALFVGIGFALQTFFQDIISGILMLITSMFLFFLKIKDLKSQKIIVIGLIFFWFTVSFFSIFVTFSNLWITLLTSSIGIVSFLASRNLKKEIIAELNKKGLTEKEIYLLQKLAGISKK